MDDKITSFTSFGGCSAKLGAALLDKALCDLKQPDYPNLLVAYQSSDDCGVYKLNDELAMVQTIDFFPPVCEDPYLFGQITAANALSDIYAMGAKPLTAVSVLCFPEGKLDDSYLRKMMQGALSKLIEAETALVGGHSINDATVKFGFSVNGVVNPNSFWTNNGSKGDELLIITKPIGIGLVSNAVRAQVASKEEAEEVFKVMTTLNRKASEVLRNFEVRACTDITGFSLLGHLCEMAQTDGDVTLVLDYKRVPIIGNAKKYAQEDLTSAQTYKNINDRGKFVGNLDILSIEEQRLFFDPQTSGPLVASVAKSEADEALKALRSEGVDAHIIGYTEKGKKGLRII
ncbi:MAG: selenide, water dikinase SelD [Sphaerochaetaceae bacterium]